MNVESQAVGLANQSGLWTIVAMVEPDNLEAALSGLPTQPDDAVRALPCSRTAEQIAAAHLHAARARSRWLTLFG
jgi:hypothetical protein